MPLFIFILHKNIGNLPCRVRTFPAIQEKWLNPNNKERKHEKIRNCIINSATAVWRCI